MDYSIINNELLEALSNIPDNSFDGCFCDPPYEIGIMGKKWDGSGVAFQTETWAEVLRVLKPGAHLIAFGGTRTYHRLTCAIEDAGFEIRDSLMWVYGSGFPKSLDISKACDKEIGADRDVVGFRKHPTLKDYSKVEEQANAAHGGNSWAREWALTAPATDQAKLFKGYGTALKPAYEPCILARKPIEGTVAANCMNHGCGGLNIDGCRVTTEDNLKKLSQGRKDNALQDSKGMFTPGRPPVETGGDSGRFPANLIHDGSDEVVGLFPDSDARPAKAVLNGGVSGDGGNNGLIYSQSLNHGARTGYADTERSAARFFYTAKASKKERGEGNNHPCVKPLSLCKYLSKLILPPVHSRLLVPFSGSGSEMMGALKAGWSEVVGIEREPEYVEIAKHRIENMKESVKTEEKGPIQGSLFEVEVA